MLHKLLAHSLVCLFLVETSVVLEIDNVLGVNEIKLEIFCENERVEILTAACRKIATRAVHHSALYVLKLSADVEVKSETCDDRIVSVGYLCIYLVNALVISYLFVALIEHIRNLDVILEALSGRGRNDVTALIISLYNACYLLEMLGVRKRATAEFYYFDLHTKSPLYRILIKTK